MVAEQKRTELLNEVKALRISVNPSPPDNLLKKAINSFNARGFESNRDFEVASTQSSQAFLSRIQVNYARHELTHYDSAINALFARVGKQQAYELLKERTLLAISAA